jgi:hypothetical protein
MQIYLEQIWQAAQKKDYLKVRELLSMNLFNYRYAQLFCELFKNDIESSQYIKQQSTCHCGKVVTRWKLNTAPTCTICSFEKAIQNIEYAKPNNH